MIWVFFLGLVVANIFVFVSQMRLGEDINYYEKEVRRLHQENIELEKKAYAANSLQYAASKAAEMEFVKKTEPYFLENLRYALKE